MGRSKPRRKNNPVTTFKIEHLANLVDGTLVPSPFLFVTGGRTMFDRGARILIVDDTACLRTTMSHVLSEVGYRVRSAEDGFSALRECRQELPDVILCDLNMPGMSGFELLQVIRHRFPGILVIAMSGSFSGSEVPSGVAADAFYQKGSSIGALLQILMTPHRMKRPAPQPPSATTPLRIHCNGNEPAGIEEAAITCPECMRTFDKTLEGPFNFVCELDCVHCGSPIQYIIVTTADQTSTRAFQHQGRSAIMSHNASTPAI
jgi:CheY-like chemotaxis protein